MRGLVQHTGVDGGGHQVVGGGDGVDVPGQVEVELREEGGETKPRGVVLAMLRS